ncbi:hypothetical protein HII31_09347 [Pseudocercospora fuligena]|uniref:Uncharacterized protein n=1 Tax=Pseudocercospora fuligena TaxID=685502 RepID=A0A8H6RD24_9PEZI|nr:hypothetical protein HII31_09347 [Pseudocercospora fuligena]
MKSTTASVILLAIITTCTIAAPTAEPEADPQRPGDGGWWNCRFSQAWETSRAGFCVRNGDPSQGYIPCDTAFACVNGGNGCAPQGGAIAHCS